MKFDRPFPGSRVNLEMNERVSVALAVAEVNVLMKVWPGGGD